MRIGSFRSNYASEEANAMKKLLVRSLVISLLAFQVANSMALGQSPPGPTIASAASASTGNISGEFDLINAILDFSPGAAMPSHTHGGLTLVAVLEGELTNAFEGQAAKAFRVGENWVEQP
jgi:quercetin dioxygenase-like cupin family protein